MGEETADSRTEAEVLVALTNIPLQWMPILAPVSLAIFLWRLFRV